MYVFNHSLVIHIYLEKKKQKKNENQNNNNNNIKLPKKKFIEKTYESKNENKIETKPNGFESDGQERDGIFEKKKSTRDEAEVKEEEVFFSVHRDEKRKKNEKKIKNYQS